MKKIFNIVFVSGLLVALAGCSGFLDEDMTGQIAGKEVLSTQKGLDAALTGAYSALASMWNYGFINGQPTECTVGGDDLTCQNAAGDMKDFDQYQVNSSSGSLDEGWRGCYKAIQGANNVILNSANTSGDPNEIKKIVGEAHFLRAWCYFWVVRLHGDVPLILTSDYSEDLLKVERASYKVIYKQIEDDLLAAITMLGDKGREIGRPGIGTCKALLAEVYLQEGGWPMKDASKYALAAQIAREVIENRAKYGFGLVATHAELYANDDTKLSISSEDVWVIPTNKNASTGNCLYGAYSMPGEMGGWNVIFSELQFYNDFPAGPRKDATFAEQYYNKTTNPDRNIIIGWNQLGTKHPYYQKLWKTGSLPDYGLFESYLSSLPMPMLRYTHVLTTYAEAKARSGGPDQLAYDCINEIRKRAAGHPDDLPAGMTADNFARAAVQERAWELCAERTRWFDLVRLEILAEVVAKKDSKDIPPIRPITEAVYLLPIPNADVLVNPNLK